ncbi:helix-turn-helix domain-containing protein [Azospirillum sp. 11R-A]|uniref:helix-turn-helix domain-containing protein n=1 Tax=Azospirillum sp. 11R-A TaxID=3111634 RepID=UPI003C163875
MSEDIHPGQLRAARALIGWTREALAEAAGTTTRTLARLEGGETEARSSTARAIRRALEAAGVIFIDENGEGPGVRLKKADGKQDSQL